MMNRSIALVAVLALFASGLAIGALGTHLFYSRQLSAHGAPGHFGGPRWGGPEPIVGALELSAEQREKIRLILIDSRREAQGIREEIQPRVLDLVGRTSQRMRAILTAEQQQRFDRLRRLERGRLEHHLLGPPEGPGPGGMPRDRRDRHDQPRSRR